MSDLPLRYAVVLTDPAARKPNELAQVLAPLRGRPAQDLLVPIRECWGIIARDVAQEQALREAAALEQAGLRALAIPMSLLEEPPVAEIVRALEAVAPPQLLVAAAFNVKTVRKIKEQQGPGMKERALKLGVTLATGLPLGLGSKREVERAVESSELVYFLDIYFGVPLRRWRIDAQDFDYSFLKERMGYDAAGNFRKVLEALGQRAVTLNRGAEGILAGKPVRELGYESLKDLDREACWLLTLAALKIP